MIRFSSSGNFSRTIRSLTKIGDNRNLFGELEKYAQQGADALASATPIRTGETAQSWAYKINVNRDGATITWYNTHVNQGANVAILLQYGHGTGTGGWVQGYDYINPAIKPIFDRIADDVWKKVSYG